MLLPERALDGLDLTLDPAHAVQQLLFSRTVWLIDDGLLNREGSIYPEGFPYRGEGYIFEMNACRKQPARLDCPSSLGSSLLSVSGKRTRQHTRPAAVARSA
ncbi:hypothetical protein C7S14_1852 [Burkholderia cepacia]|nr:hypothetical protein C7S14_1852 [Burkholderia cepacia]